MPAEPGGWRGAIRPWLTPKVVGRRRHRVDPDRLSEPLAPWISPYDPNGQNLAHALRPPDGLFGPHVLGTDAVGRDILSRLFYGARISLVIAVMVVIISGVVGTGARRDLRLLRRDDRFC